MGYRYQRECAARTVIRARATGDPDAIRDAEEAVSSYLDEDDLDDYVERWFPNGIETKENETA